MCISLLFIVLIFVVKKRRANIYGMKLYPSFKIKHKKKRET